MTEHTIVQHSAAGYKRNPQFVAGLESRAVTPAEAKKVEQAGGLLFASYDEAESWAEAEQYPPDYTGLTPRAPGTFAQTRIDGLRIYKPVPTKENQ